uniref:Uncharacterized protein n=1 Tax=Ciona intestinalis TaxID=7719 RepID=F6Y1C5_CIOIN
MPFQEMTIRNNIVVISVVESKDNKVALRCSEDSYKLIYNYSQYITTNYDGDEIIFVNETESYYMNGEYQMLDWRITITEDGTSYSSLADSRVAVCELLVEPPLPPVCNIYLPLNQSEYVVLANGSLWMEDRQLLIDPDTYIPFGDSVAVCIDGYTPPEDISSNTVDTETEIDPVVEIINWCTFGLTLFSLLSLFLTFLTYLFFR